MKFALTLLLQQGTKREKPNEFSIAPKYVVNGGGVVPEHFVVFSLKGARAFHFVFLFFFLFLLSICLDALVLLVCACFVFSVLFHAVFFFFSPSCFCVASSCQRYQTPSRQFCEKLLEGCWRSFEQGKAGVFLFFFSYRIDFTRKG